MKRLKTTVSAAMLMAVSLSAGAKSPVFDQVFNDSTLRIDYIFGGNDKTSLVMLDHMHKWKGWAGKRNNLEKIPYVGYGIITVTDSLTGDTIYRHSFSSLFREWQATPEAKQTSKSFQNSFLVPLPKAKAMINIVLLDMRHDKVAENTHVYTPGDILVKKADEKKTVPFRYVHKGGDPNKAIDVALLAEGYTEAEMDKFYADAKRAADAMFTHEPYKSRKNDFNFIAVAAPSVDSGVSVPRDGVWKNTAFKSHYDTFYSDRYLTTSNIFDVYDALNGIPFEHLIILVNSPMYGGGGIYNSSTLSTTGHPTFVQVLVHEFGHSFGGLADEYFYDNDVMTDSYPLDVEPTEPNITTLVDFDSKWKSMLKKGTPVPTPIELKDKYPLGVFEGGGYSSKGVYRPVDKCRMRVNDVPNFCPVCEKAINDLIDFYTK